MSLASGVHVQGYFSFRSGVVDHLEFLGEGGRIRVDRHATVPELWVNRRLGYGVRRAWVSMPVVDRWAQARRWTRPAEDPSYFRALRDFIARVRGAENESATLEDGIRSLQLVLAAEASASAGKPVCLAPTEPRG
jgi:predicted dehydrogenase